MILRCIVERMQIKQSKGGRDVSDWVGDFSEDWKGFNASIQPAGWRTLSDFC